MSKTTSWEGCKRKAASSEMLPAAKRARMDHAAVIEPRSCTSFLDLPNELLDIIFSDISEGDIISIGTLCRRFNEVAFSRHFFRPALKSPPGLFWNDPTTFHVGTFRTTPDFSPWSFRTFQAIRLALFHKPKINVLNTRFSWAFPDEAKQISKFFDTRPTLHSVTIDLPYGPGPAGLGLQWQKKRNELSKQQLVDNRLALYDILRSLTRVKPDEVHMGNQLMLDFGQGIPIDDDDESNLPEPFDGPLLTTPTMLTFSYCPYLFSPPIRNWTIDSLNASPLRRLVIEDVDVGPHLCELTLPYLEDIVVRSRLVSHSQLNEFLSRHSSLADVTVFRMAPRDTQKDTQDAIKPGALPNVQEVTAPTEFFTTWLDVPDALSSIRDVRIEGRPSPETMQFIFDRLAKRATTRTLHLPLCHLSEDDKWLSLSPRAEGRMEGICRVDLGLPIGWRMTEERMKRIISAIALFPGVKSVSIWPATDQGVWGKDFLGLLGQLCPGVKEAVFDFEKVSCDFLSSAAGEDD